MYQQFFNLITKKRNGELSRQQFCHAWAKLQGYNDAVKGFGNKHGTYLLYRGRSIQLINEHFTWRESEEVYSAKTVRELKIKIDCYEKGVRWS